MKIKNNNGPKILPCGTPDRTGDSYAGRATKLSSAISSSTVSTGNICQVVGKPIQTIPVAPLKLIPARGEPFNDTDGGELQEGGVAK